ncbi:MAG: GtrA family protein [Flavobacteriales bacterium]|nr:GtrA family protein [Flavobacteriales bacterium]
MARHVKRGRRERIRAAIKGMPETNKQVSKFAFIGGLAVLTDLSCYGLLLNTLPPDVLPGELGNEALAKTLSFLCGLLVTYYFNKRWTWRQTDRDTKRLMRFMATYGVSLLLNVGMNSALLKVLHGVDLLAFVPHKYLVAFAGATGFCAAFNFVAQKYWVFKTKASGTEPQQL